MRYILISLALALSLAGSAFGATFSFSASSPTSPLSPTVNNGSTQLLFNPVGGTLTTNTDVGISQIILVTAVNAPADVWDNVPFLFDLVVEDSHSGAKGVFAIRGFLNGTTKLGTSLLTAKNLNASPSEMNLGGKTYTITTISWMSPAPSTRVGVSGSPSGQLIIRLKEAVIRKTNIDKINPVENF